MYVKARNRLPWTANYDPTVSLTKREGESSYDFARRMAAAHGVTLDQVRTPRRHRTMVKIRWAMIANLKREVPAISTTRLGMIFDRDHTSIVHALRCMNERG